jgi:cellobiose phosphorylase
MVAGKDAKFFGQGKNSWLTGTAAWTFVNISQYILGIQPDYDGLRIDPCVPENFGDYTIERKYRGAEYHIRVTNPNHVQKGIQSLTVNGRQVEGNLVPFEEGVTEYTVTAVMG